MGFGRVGGASWTGARGAVWRAYDREKNRLVALKLILTPSDRRKRHAHSEALALQVRPRNRTAGHCQRAIRSTAQ